MKIQNPILLSKKSRAPFFDGDDLKSGAYKFKCSKCKNPMIINCFSIYTGAWSQIFSNEILSEIESFFGVDRAKNKSLESGWPSFSIHYCKKCGIPYVVVADFDEYRNSVYRITMQGIAQCW